MVATISNRIHKLPTVLANQIAAGEVIERPASVVKELLENSVDAGATEINIEIKKGGRSLICVADNGGGIHPDDLDLALSQHATSKLQQDSDLTKINSLGFRGEALSSIAAIARVSISSCIAGAEHGWIINAERHTKEPVSMGQGTTVDVCDLFANIPARRKFLRTDNTEFFHIREICRRVALSYHAVAFCLKHNDKNVMRYPAQADDVSARVQAIFGRSFSTNAFALDCQRGNLRLWGWFGHFETARNQTDQQYFYLNGRMIRDKQVNHAVRMATEGRFYAGKHPVYVLFLEMDPAEVDINVHPAKHEVRFLRAKDVHDFILSVLRQVFSRPLDYSSKDLSSAPLSVEQDDVTSPPGMSRQHIESPTMQGHGANKTPAMGRSLPINYPQSAPFYKGANHRPAGISKQVGKLFAITHDLFYVDQRYVITHIGDEIFLLDIFLSQEIVALAGLQKDFAAGGIRRRPLLVPFSISVNTIQSDFFVAQSAMFESFGLQLQHITDGSILVREVPLLLEYADISSLIADMEGMIKSHKPSVEVMQMMARHAHDAGLIKLDHGQVAQLLLAVRKAQSAATGQPSQRAWQLLDGESLRELLRGNRK